MSSIHSHHSSIVTERKRMLQNILSKQGEDRRKKILSLIRIKKWHDVYDSFYILTPPIRGNSFYAFDELQHDKRISELFVSQSCQYVGCLHLWIKFYCNTSVSEVCDFIRQKLDRVRAEACTIQLCTKNKLKEIIEDSEAEWFYGLDSPSSLPRYMFVVTILKQDRHRQTFRDIFHK